MSTCTFFGHRNAPDKIEPALRSTLVDLIEDSGVTLLYVGNQGGFDDMVYRLLRELSARYPITVYVVLAYMPETHKKNDISCRKAFCVCSRSAFVR